MAKEGEPITVKEILTKNVKSLLLLAEKLDKILENWLLVYG